PVRLLTHCHAGASRSTAAAYIALALRDGPGKELATFRELMVVTRKPWPSRMITAMADDLLSRRGAMLAPLEAYRAKHPHRLAAYVRLYQRRMRAMP
ncbi:MAG: protein tyrosine phosphatase, partial [Proteobacteria bacterium]|nr:protein tyrosine phosphatase [Pseudomonadota bacterium]